MTGIASAERAASTRLGPRAWPGAVATAVVVVAAGAVGVVAAGLAPERLPEPDRQLAFSPAAVCFVVVLVLACLSAVSDRPREAVGLSVVALAWLLPSLAALQVLDPRLRAELLAAAPLATSGIALVLIAWRPSQTAGGFLLAATGLSVAAAAVQLMGYDPFFDPACSQTCEAARGLLAPIGLGTRQAVTASAMLTVVASALVVIGAAGRGSSRTPPGLRLAAVVAVAFGSAAAVVPWWAWEDTDRAPRAQLLRGLATVAVVLPVLVAAWRVRRVRRTVRHVVAQLASPTPMAAARGSVTAVHFAVPGEGRWVDPVGRPVAAADPDLCAYLPDGDGPAVRFVLGRNADPDQVVASITAGGRLALANSRMHAAGLVHLADLRASRQRIVQATDREKRRIERDLHDGAQQRLVAVIMALSSAGRRSGAAAGAILEGEAQVRAALEALRELSHDSLTAVLGAEGLEAALDELAAGVHASVDVDLSVQPGLADRLPAEVQMAVYCTVAAGLDNVARHAKTDRASVTVRSESGVLTVSVSDHGRGGAVVGNGLTDVADRIGALGGRLDLTSSPGEGTTVTARCGS